MYLYISSLSNPLGNGFSSKTNSLDVHGVTLLGFAFGWEMHENWSCI
jgi:hypothetical protein